MLFAEIATLLTSFLLDTEQAKNKNEANKNALSFLKRITHLPHFHSLAPNHGSEVYQS